MRVGGWCPQFDIMWCIIKPELASLGFHMETHFENTPNHDPLSAIHINVLEFIELIVKMWPMLASCHSRDHHHTHHHIGNFLTDNT